jgi:hypothetical protein
MLELRGGRYLLGPGIAEPERVIEPLVDGDVDGDDDGEDVG